MKTIAAFLCFTALSVLTCHGAEFDLGTHGVLSFAVPDGWTAEVEPASKPETYALSFKPDDHTNAKCLLTFLYVTNRAPDKAVIRADVLRMCKDFVAESVEKRADVRDFSLEKGFGVYCVFTDASLVGKEVKSGSYKVMGSGQVQSSEDMVGVVSLFADDAASAEFKAMIDIINSLKVTPKDAT